MRQGAGVRLRRDGIALVVVAVVYLTISVCVTNPYYQLILTLVPIWALFGVSWNILSGYGGQLSFGRPLSPTFFLQDQSHSISLPALPRFSPQSG